MAKYEKRSVKKIRPEKPLAKAKPERIRMKPEKSVKLPKTAAGDAAPKSNARPQKPKKLNVAELQIVKGYKEINRKKTLICVGLVVGVVSLFILASVLTPTGIGEYISNAMAAVENGSGYPQKLSGEDIVHAETQNKITYVLSETFIETYNSSGYNLISDQHGFSNPVLKTSAARALVFDRGGTGCKIYNFKKCVAEKVLDDKIMAAHIGRDGSTAFVLNSNEYASRVEVYDKDFNRRYSWNAASETISAVALSDNGSKVAVAAVKTVNGEYITSVYIFNYKSASPIFTKQIKGDIVISLYSDSKSVWAVTLNGVYRIGWKDHSSTDIEFLSGVDIVCHSYNKMAVAAPSESNSLDTTVSVFDKTGQKVISVDISGEAEDICIGKKYIYVLKSDTVEVYDMLGNFIKEIEVGYDVKYLSEPVNGSFGAVSTSNINIFKIK